MPETTVPEEVTVCGVKYRKAEPAPSGKRCVVVVDRGWIYAGDVEEKDGRLILTRAVLVFRWVEIGFDGMLANPKSNKVTLKRMPTAVDMPRDAELFRCPVADDWGIS